MKWEIVVANRAKKELLKIPQKNAERILQAIQKLENNPFAGDIKRMEGEDNVWRKRVGSYRIFYELMDEARMIRIFKIDRRTSSTY
jgi:mRNA interferase RelE/StbE